MANNDPNLIDEPTQSEINSETGNIFVEDNTNKMKNLSTGGAIGGIGSAYPYILINGYGPFTTKEILSFSIITKDFYPEISLSLQLKSGVFLSTAFPKDGDLVSVFVRSLKDDFKPIRNDYLITNISSDFSIDPAGDIMVFDIEGVLRIPYLYAETCKAIKDVTSYEALFKLATELNLGFASNDKPENFKDKQTWLCPYITNKEFIKNIAKHAYRDDESFYDVFIDLYYNLNFANMNTILSQSSEWRSRIGLLRRGMGQDYGVGDTETPYTPSSIGLTNAGDAKSSGNAYFDKFMIMNTSGETNIINGYKRNLFFYDKSLKKLCNWSIDPLITKDSEKENVVMKGRAKEDYYKKEVKSKFSGLQYSLPDHNVHNYWKHAKYHNIQNLHNLKKMYIVLNLPIANFNLYKGQLLPITFINEQDNNRPLLSSKTGDQAKTVGMSIDRFLSGKYIIIGMLYEYIKRGDSEGIWQQQVLITKREWSVPDRHPTKQTGN